ncbi:MAG: 4-alpha-glucanotransferase [Gammaproteobacteria bacterium]|nr:4-alpha-glucanotransferase [Gammaproteobacteria bacterium]
MTDTVRSVFSFSDQRRAGVLLHPTSLPGPLAKGDLGHQAYRFIEFLASCSITVWQMLPLGPTHEDDSPYQCLSAHAGNPQLISLDWLADKGWFDANEIDIDMKLKDYRSEALVRASTHFYAQNDQFWLQKLEAFKEEHAYWLHDYVLFIALKQHFGNAPWYQWPHDFRDKDPVALEKVRLKLSSLIAHIEFEQFVFFQQWQELREYAHRYGISLFGDMPIFIAHDSADLWSHRENFLINDLVELDVVAGVPPDCFSEDGQRWGNPLYDWSYMLKDDFQWWKQRFRTQLSMFDLVRIDHFRGLEACWQIPAMEETAVNGSWIKVPGYELLSALVDSYGELPVVAEDLGMITKEVIDLRKSFHLPGMKILQFAFDGNPTNPYLPHNHDACSVIYTGTHDNDTTCGWYQALEPSYREQLLDYLGVDAINEDDIAWVMNRVALASVAPLVILPLQDILSLGSDHRMNIPGTVENNWQWRFEWQQIKPGLNDRLSHMINLYERNVGVCINE